MYSARKRDQVPDLKRLASLNGFIGFQEGSADFALIALPAPHQADL